LPTKVLLFFEMDKFSHKKMHQPMKMVGAL